MITKRLLSIYIWILRNNKIPRSYRCSKSTEEERKIFARMQSIKKKRDSLEFKLLSNFLIIFESSNKGNLSSCCIINDIKSKIDSTEENIKIIKKEPKYHRSSLRNCLEIIREFIKTENRLPKSKQERKIYSIWERLKKSFNINYLIEQIPELRNVLSNSHGPGSVFQKFINYYNKNGLPKFIDNPQTKQEEVQRNLYIWMNRPKNKKRIKEELGIDVERRLPRFNKIINIKEGISRLSNFIQTYNRLPRSISDLQEELILSSWVRKNRSTSKELQNFLRNYKKDKRFIRYKICIFNILINNSLPKCGTSDYSYLKDNTDDKKLQNFLIVFNSHLNGNSEATVIINLLKEKLGIK